MSKAAPAQPAQDIDSTKGAGDGKQPIVNPGKPVEHVDVEDGQSVGHSAEPEHAEGSRGNEPAQDTKPKTEPGREPKVSRDEIYTRHKNRRTDELESDYSALTPEQKREYDRMVAEAGGGADPYAEPAPTEPAAQPAAQPVQPTAQPTAQPAQPAQPTAQPSAEDEMVTTVIYGMREEVPKRVVDEAGGLAQYQKVRAAEVRLERLATYEASLRNYDRQLAERAAQLEQSGRTPARDGTGSQDPSPTDDPDSAVNEQVLAKEIVESMFSGDQEAATKRLADSLASIRKEARRAAVPAQPTTQPVSPATGQWGTPDPAEQQRREANAVFASEFQDLAGSPVLRSAVLSMVKAVEAEPWMQGRPLAEITREAGMRVRQEVYGDNPPPRAPVDPSPPSLHPGQPPRTAQDLGTRMALKSRTVITPAEETGMRYQDPASQQPKIPSNTEYVNELRKSRGQAPL